MFRSIRLFKIAGIPVFVHWTFFILIFYVIGQGIADSETIAQLIFEVSILLSVFLCVTLHEYGHALTAKRFGIITQDIILSPIGGIARLSGLPEKPFQEFLVAIAGPLVNVAIVILISILVFFLYPGESFNPNLEKINNQNFIDNYLFIMKYINISLIVFNMIPAFPMDGGRVLRSLLAMKFGKVNATKVAAFIGQVIAVLFVIVAITKYPIFGSQISTMEQFTLSIIGIFIFSMARTEYSNVKMEDKLMNTTASSIMEPHFTHLYVSDNIDFALSRFQAGLEKEFLVFDENDQCIGTLKKEILELLLHRGENATVQSFYFPIINSLNVDDNVKDIMAKIANSKETIFPVYENHKVVGALYRKEIEKIFRSAM